MKKKTQKRSRTIPQIPVLLIISATLILLFDIVFSKNKENYILSKDFQKLIEENSPSELKLKNTTLSESDFENIFINFTVNQYKKEILNQNQNQIKDEKAEFLNANESKEKTTKQNQQENKSENKRESLQAEILKEIILKENLKEIIETSNATPEILQECLASEASEKLSKNSNGKKQSKSQKFILGKCNPVLFVAGFLGTRLRAVIDCPSLANDTTALSELRFFCGKTLCKNSFFSGYKKEEYTLWPSLFNSPFKLFQDKSNPDNSCMAYFMRFFNDENECPFLEEEGVKEHEKEIIQKQREIEKFKVDKVNIEVAKEIERRTKQQILYAFEDENSEINKELPKRRQEIKNLIEKNVNANFTNVNNAKNDFKESKEIIKSSNKSTNLKYTETDRNNQNYKKEKANSSNKNKNSNSETKKKAICFHSKHIKVTFFGNTEETHDKLNCGLNAMCNILDLGFPLIPEKLVNTPATAGYFKLSEFFKAKGFEEGFSYAGLPYDFRNFSKKDSKFQKQFFELVQMLHKNTGKKVIVVAHSLGNLLINDILSLPENKQKTQKMIERNIALAPPYIGTMKDMELFISGTLEFKADLPAGNVVDVSLAAQKFFGSFNPNFYLLLMKPFMHSLLKKPEYREFVEAVSERLKLERRCKSLIDFGQKNENDFVNKKSNKEECSDDFIEENSKKFNGLFPFIPKLNSPECKKLYAAAQQFVNETNFVQEKINKRKDIYENLPTYEGCFLRIYDYLNCPFIKVKDENDTSVDVNEFDEFCLDSEEEIEKGIFTFSLIKFKLYVR